MKNYPQRLECARTTGSSFLKLFSRHTANIIRDSPVVLRPSEQKHAHVGLLWQALFFVPQVRERIAEYRGPVPTSLVPTENGVLEVEPPIDGPGKFHDMLHKPLAWIVPPSVHRRPSLVSRRVIRLSGNGNSCRTDWNACSFSV
jgi:hypothetical protein